LYDHNNKTGVYIEAVLQDIAWEKCGRYNAPGNQRASAEMKGKFGVTFSVFAKCGCKK